MTFESFTRFLPFLIPIALIELVLLAAALWDLAHREHTRGPKWVWAAIIVFVSLFGPIAYFMLGREE